jgi:hypothetical protein
MRVGKCGREGKVASKMLLTSDQSGELEFNLNG